MSDQGAEKLHILSKWSRGGGGLGVSLLQILRWREFVAGGG